MNREFVRLNEFEKCCKSIGLTENDINEIEGILIKDSSTGNVVEGTGGLRKMGFSLNNRGKSAGARILYVDFVVYEKIYFITAYTKGEQDNLSYADKNEIKQLIHYLELELGKKGRNECI